MSISIESGRLGRQLTSKKERLDESPADPECSIGPLQSMRIVWMNPPTQGEVAEMDLSLCFPRNADELVELDLCLLDEDKFREDMSPIFSWLPSWLPLGGRCSPRRSRR